MSVTDVVPGQATTAGPMVKKTLVTLSHAMEQAALAAGGDRPLVVAALFQRLPYFDQERALYRELSEHADAVIVGFVDDFRPELPGRIDPVLLDMDEPLAREWTVVVATPQMGAFLVAYDEERAAPGERTLEAGRLFSGRWGFSTAGAHTELRRLCRQLADRVPPGTLAVIDQVVAGSNGQPAKSGGPGRTEAALRLLVDEMERARRHGVALQNRLEAVTHSADRDLSSQLHTPTYLRRWAGTNRTTTAGPLPMALLQLSIPQLSGVTKLGTRAEREVVSGIAAVLTRRLEVVDRAVRLAEDEFLLVVPGIGEEAAADLIRQVVADLGELADVYPFVPLEPVCAVTVTRQRPLPLEELRETVRWAAAQNIPIALLPG